MNHQILETLYSQWLAKGNRPEVIVPKFKELKKRSDQRRANNNREVFLKERAELAKIRSKRKTN